MSAPSWPELKADHPIITLFKRLPEIFAASEGYSEVWGIELVGPNPVAISPTSSEPPVIAEEPVPETKPATEDKPADATVEAIVDDKPTKDKTTPTVSDTGDKITPTVSASDDKPAAPVEQPAFTTSLILQKFLRANANSIEKAFSQLKDTLVWRKDFFSPDGEASKGWSDSKFEGIGFTTVIKHKDGKDKVVSWNIYGAAKDIKKTFGTLDEFIRWRVNLMERSLQLLHLKDATEPIPDFGKGADPYQCLQVHDYQSVSFLRLPSEVKTASKKTIQMFARYYPETLERKFFVK